MQYLRARRIQLKTRLVSAGRYKRLIWPGLLLVIIGGLLLVGCGGAPVVANSIPAVVEPTERDGINRVILTEQAASRLDIQTTTISEEVSDGSTFLVVPYGALIYDLDGNTWVYASPSSLTYIREPVVVESIEGDKVLLSEGPEVGTTIATVGVAELYGTDTGVGK